MSASVGEDAGALGTLIGSGPANLARFRLVRGSGVDFANPQVTCPASGGGIGILIILLIGLFFGINPLPLLQQVQQNQPAGNGAAVQDEEVDEAAGMRRKEIVRWK